MRVLLLAVGIISVTLSGCASVSDPYSPEQLARSVVGRGPGYWAVSFPYHAVIDQHGPSLLTVRTNVRNAKDYEEVEAIWQRAVAEAVPRYLQANKLIPQQCKHGVQVVRSGSAQGGTGWAEFECKAVQ